ncbi:colanic acid exporter [Serratia proteamaculans]|uniref:flippase n=1 Tax=Serratia proteamaculans TaxID=28151 RepID=UPI0010208E3C|nr:flippase [Serratia proteamaculans]CAI2443777.1 colanic acid exporter [Serratia proteamaculans]
MKAIIQKITNFKNKEGDSGKAVSNTLWLLGERISTIALNMVLSIVMARSLGTKDFGVYNYIVSIVVILTPLTALGLNAIAVKEFIENKSKELTTLGTTCVLRFFGALAGAVVLILADYIFDISGDNFIWIVLLSLVNAFTCFQVLDFWFQSQLNSKMAVLGRFSILLISSVSKLIALIFFDAGITTIMIIQTCEVALSGISFLIIYIATGGKISRWNADFDFAKSLLRRSWWLILSGVAEIIYLKIDQIMLGKMVGYDEVAIYAVAAKLSETWYFLPTIIMTSFFPVLINSKRKSHSEYIISLQQLTDRLCLLAIGIAIAVTLVAKPVIILLYGTQYAESATILSIHIWAGVFVFMRAVLSKWLVIENLLKFSLVTHLCGAGLNVVLNLILIPPYGAIGASIATIISYAASSYFSLFMFKRTRAMGLVMTKSLLSPVFYIKRLVVR